MKTAVLANTITANDQLKPTLEQLHELGAHKTDHIKQEKPRKTKSILKPSIGLVGLVCW